MKAIWLENKIARLRDDLPVPTIGAGEALIKVNLAGVCSTDLEMVKGYYPFTGVMGHEFTGMVEEAPDAPEWLGKRVAGEINIVCGKCEACCNGRSTHCANRQTLGIHNYDGVFAEYVRLPIANLHAVPDALADEQAVFTELVAAALEVTEQVHLQPTDRVVVVGAGRLGLLIAQALKLTGCDLTVVVRRPEPARLLDAWGIRSAYATELQDKEADVVVEVTGSAQGFATSRRLVRPRGRVVLKSTFAGDVSVDLSSLVVDEVTLTGSRCGPFAPALRLMEAGAIQTQPLITATYPLEEGLQALEHAARPGTLKVLIKP